MSNNRFTIPLTAAHPGRLGATPADRHLAMTGQAWLDTTWSVIDSGGARLAATRDGSTTIVTRIGNADLARQVADLVSSLRRKLPAYLADLAAAANGTPVDLPRLGRHIWDTGTDPWQLPGATSLLADLARATGDLPDPVRAALADTVFATWDWFGPVLVPANLEWRYLGLCDSGSEDVDISVALASADDDEVIDLVETGLEGSYFVETLTGVDETVADIFDDYDVEEGVWAHLSDDHLPALRSWVAVNRPHLLSQVDDLLA